MISVDLEQEDEKELAREYIAMLVESNTSSTAYTESLEVISAGPSKEAPKLPLSSVSAFTCNTHIRAEPNRNMRQWYTAEGKGKEKAPNPPEKVHVPRRIQHLKKKTTTERLPYPSNEQPRNPKETTVKPVAKIRSLPEGYSSLGIKALHIKAMVSSINGVEIRGWLNSGADITLMSEEYWETLKERPPIKEGLQMRLYHLTGYARVLGYVRTTLYTKDTNDLYASFELEAYVVRGMKVPLLLGEDFQTMYELGIRHCMMGMNEVLVGRTGRVIPASSTKQVDLGFEVRQAHLAQSFVKRKPCHNSKLNWGK
jgi:hypothetical protein